VTDADEVMELAGAFGVDIAPEPTGAAQPHDGLDWAARRVLDALPVRAVADIDVLTRAAGLSASEVRGALGALELAGHAERRSAGWRKTTGRT
jgi:DNA processing protein